MFKAILETIFSSDKIILARYRRKVPGYCEDLKLGANFYAA